MYTIWNWNKKPSEHRSIWNNNIDDLSHWISVDRLTGRSLHFDVLVNDKVHIFRNRLQLDTEIEADGSIEAKRFPRLLDFIVWETNHMTVLRIVLFFACHIFLHLLVRPAIICCVQIWRFMTYDRLPFHLIKSRLQQIWLITHTHTPFLTLSVFIVCHCYANDEVAHRYPISIWCVNSPSTSHISLFVRYSGRFPVFICFWIGTHTICKSLDVYI